MKKSILIIFSTLFFSGFVQAQVGINTTKPQGMFHVDARGDTNGSSNVSDDVIVTNDGNVGIGTIAPVTLVDIRTGGTSASPVPGFKLQDGNETDGNILAMNSAGFATWQNFVPTGATQIVRPADAGVNLGFNDPNYYNTKSYITLAPGRWALNSISLISGNMGSPQTPISMNSTLADNATVGNSGGGICISEIARYRRHRACVRFMLVR